MFTAESDGGRILKIGQHLPKLWAIKYRVVFFMKHPVHNTSCLKKLVPMIFWNNFTKTDRISMIFGKKDRYSLSCLYA